MNRTEREEEQLQAELFQLRKRVAEQEAEIFRLQQDRDAFERADTVSSIILGATSEMFAYYDTDLRILWANKASGESVGRSPRELLGHHCYEVWHHRKEPCRNCPVLKAKETGEQQEAEATAPDGRTWFLRGYPVKDDRNQVVALVEVGLNITERKQAEKALQESEEKYSRIVETANEGIWAMDDEFRTTFVNRRMADMLGYTPEEMSGRRVDSFMIEEDLGDHAVKMKERKEGRRSVYERRFRRKDGQILWAIVSAAALRDAQGRFAGSFAMFTDITERKQAEEALQESERKWRSIFENAPLGIFHSIPSGKFIHVNPALAGMFKYESPDELIQRVNQTSIAEVLYVDQPKREQLVKRAGSGTGEWIQAENQYRCKDGSVVTANLRFRQINTAGEYPVLLEGFIEDITERKRAEELLRKSEALLRRAELMAGFGNWEFVLSSKAVHASEGARRIYGLGQDEWNIETIQKVPLPQYRPILDEALHALIHEGRPYDVRFKIRRPNDDCIVDIHSTAEYDHEHHVVFGVIQDITERERAEQERLELERRLLHAQKLESLGVLAGGIAHDFNNLLMAILGNLELSLLDLSGVPSVRLSVEQAIVAAKRAADLTRQMLAYSGKGRFVVSDLDLSELVEENVGMLKSVISKTVTLNLHLGGSLPLVSADAGQIQQIVMNLITNASEAIDESDGLVILSTGTMECDEEYLSRNRIEEKPAPGWFVFLEVADTGYGMDEETQRRLFDPFFTTKFMGRGLGMSAVLGIVRGHNGALIIESEPGQGTIVRVLFPVSEQSRAGRVRKKDSGAERERRTELPAQSGTVLVVDDEEVVRNLCVTMVSRFGFKTLSAADGEEALRVFRNHADEIVLVLLDLTMPRMDGVATFEALRRIKPGVKVILSSGYNEQEATRRFTDKGLAGFIQKPYRLRALGAELERVLDSGCCHELI